MADTLNTLRPNNGQAGAGWGTVVGAANIWTAAADGAAFPISGSPASDGTYGLGDGAVGDVLSVWFTGFGVPAYAIIKSVEFQARIAGSGGQYSMFGGIVSGYSEVLLDHTLSNVTPPINVTGGPHSTKVDGSAWTASDIANLRLDVWAWNPGTVKLIEAYAVVAYNQAPTATPTLPAAGNVITSQPAVGWTYADPEGDLEDRWRVKVFAAATYGAAGFNPETSTPAWDSGERLTPATSVTVGAQLANNTTFKAYAKAADVGSSGRYGPWTAGPAFTTRVELPAAPVVVSATPDPTLNRVAVKLQGQDNELTRNQASAESGIVGLEADTNVAATYPKRSVAQFIEGAASFLVRSAAAGDVVVRTPVSSTAVLFPCLPSTQYTTLASFRAAATTRSARVDFFWFTSSGAASATPSTAGTAVSATSGGFTQAFCTATSPADAAFYALKPRVLATAAANEDFYIDQLSAAPGASTTWTRGGFVNNLSPAADTFNRADSATTLGTASGAGGAWAALTATWGISSNQAYYAAGAGIPVAALTLPLMDDGTLTVDILMGPATTSDGGVVLRAADGLNFIGVGINKSASSNTIYLLKYVAGVGTALAVATGPGILNNTTYGLKVQFFGGRFVVSLDKKDGNGYVQLIDWTLSAADLALFAGPTNNKYGLFLAADAGVRWDNFTVNANTSQRLIVERSVDGGATWETVRSINQVDLADPDQVATFYDYEAPRNTAIQYRARSQGSEVDLTVLSAYSAALAMVPNLAGDGNAWLKSPSDPTLNMPVNLVQDTAGSDSVEDLAVFNPLGRPDPLIHGGTIRLEYFPELGFMELNDAQWQAFTALRARQEPLLLQTCYGDGGGPSATCLECFDDIDGGAPGTIFGDGLEGGDPDLTAQAAGPSEQFWIRLGATRSVTRITMPPSPGQLRGIKISAYEVATPAVA